MEDLLLGLGSCGPTTEVPARHLAKMADLDPKTVGRSIFGLYNRKLIDRGAVPHYDDGVRLPTWRLTAAGWDALVEVSVRRGYITAEEAAG